MLNMKTARSCQTLLLELHHLAAPKSCDWVLVISIFLVCHLEGCILGELLGGQHIFMAAFAINQLKKITELMGTLTRVDLDATQFSFPFFFCLFAPQKDLRQMFVIPARVSIMMCLTHWYICLFSTLTFQIAKWRDLAWERRAGLAFLGTS